MNVELRTGRRGLVGRLGRGGKIKILKVCFEFFNILKVENLVHS
jgi:hypothetical protein